MNWKLFHFMKRMLNMSSGILQRGYAGRALKVLPLLLFCINTNATNYYVSNTGNNSNAGTSPGAAWQTVAKVVSSLGSIGATDSVLFNRDDVFQVSASFLLVKNGLNIGAYGTGARPKLTALTTVSGWTLVSTGLYKASLVAPDDLRYVTIDGQPVEWGRTPNKNQGLSSYYYADSVGSLTFKDNQLPASPNRTGHRFWFSGWTWSKHIGLITSHTGNYITYRVGVENLLTGQNPTFRPLTEVGAGYCFVGNVADCDQYGEWAYDSTAQELYMFFGAVNPNSKVVKAATVDRVFDMAGYGSVSIQNIEIEGANKASIYGANGNGPVVFKNMYFNGCGGKAILLSNTANVTIQDDTLLNTYNMAIRATGGSKSGTTIQRVRIDNNGPFETMHYFGDDQDGAAVVSGNSNTTITDLTINRSHYHGLSIMAGSNVRVTNLYVNRHGLWSNDCGGLYAIGSNSGGTITNWTNRIDSNSVIDSGMAYVYGYSNVRHASVKGKYMDARTPNFTHKNGLIRNCDVAFANNTPNGISILNNDVFATQHINMMWRNYASASGSIAVTNFLIRGNYFGGLTSTAGTVYYYNDSLGSQTIAQSLSGRMTMDSNVSCNTGTAYQTETQSSPGIIEGGKYVTKKQLYKVANYLLPAWRTATGVSASDTQVPFFPLGDLGTKVIVNWSNTAQTYSLLYKYKSKRNVPFYNGSIVLPAKSWYVLIYDGPLDSSPEPETPPQSQIITAPWIIKQ